MTEPEVKLRADAQANRDRILSVARGLLAEDPQVSLNMIAKAAGVGAGTLYRHFPNRESLVLYVYRNEIEVLVALAPTLLTAHPPLEAFRLWCGRLTAFGRVKHGVGDLLHAAISEQELEDTYWPMLDAVRQLVSACEQAGEIRAGANAEDFLVLMGLLWRVPPTPAGEARVRRLLELAFRGLGVND